MHLFQLFKGGEIIKTIKSDKSFYIKLVIVCIAVIISVSILYYIMSPIIPCLRTDVDLAVCARGYHLSW